MTEHWRTFALIGCALVGVLILSAATSPKYSFDPFCTYDESYKLDAIIEVDGRTYSSHVVRQTTRSRDWIYNLNQNGCSSSHGTALSFRLPDNRAFLLRATLCRDARQAL